MGKRGFMGKRSLINIGRLNRKRHHAFAEYLIEELCQQIDASRRA
jgi:hypothetical protein